MNTTKRKFWLEVLSLSKPETVYSLWEKSTLNLPLYEYLRKPETGLYMVRGKTDPDKQIFNLGEVIVSRCAVKTKDNFKGISYIKGSDIKYCEFCAVLDGAMQNEKNFTDIYEKIIEPAFLILEQEKKKNFEKINKTKVEFFTMGKSDGL
ncbi:MAG: phosphonate C-P lyase system protein PhnG [Desulforegulaceae bacterium]|nr:phosphonate C-P lyase system protein PhnG [Desulforegulaceae bacterium]